MSTVKAKAKPKVQYGADRIQVLKGLEAVRRRPGMYVGGTDAKALHHLVYEIVDNSVDEALAGRCDRVEVIIHPDSSVTVKDNGIGRKAAAKIKSQNARKHKSVSLEVTKERLEFLNDGIDGKSLIFKDLNNGDGSVTGTEVVIKLPLEEW